MHLSYHALKLIKTLGMFLFIWPTTIGALSGFAVAIITIAGILSDRAKRIRKIEHYYNCRLTIYWNFLRILSRLANCAFSGFLYFIAKLIFGQHAQHWLSLSIASILVTTGYIAYANISALQPVLAQQAAAGFVKLQMVFFGVCGAVATYLSARLSDALV